MQLIEQVCHDHKIDLFKLQREWDPRRGIELEENAGIYFGPFHVRFLLDRAPEQVQEILQKKAAQRHLEYIECVRQGFVGDENDQPFPGFNIRSAAIASTTTETNLWDPSLPQYGLLPKGVIVPGRAWIINCGGVCGTTATPTIAWRARCGTNNSAPPTGTDLGIGPTFTLGTFTAQPFWASGIWGCRSTGQAASGATITGNGYAIHAGAAAATTVGTPVFGGAVPATIDQTVDQGLAYSITWGASSSSNTLTPQWMTKDSRG